MYLYMLITFDLPTLIITLYIDNKIIELNPIFLKTYLNVIKIYNLGQILYALGGFPSKILNSSRPIYDNILQVNLKKCL